MAVIVIADHDGSVLRDATHKTVAAATALSGEIDVLVLGAGARGPADQASRIAGVRKVLLAESESLGHGLAEAVEAVVVPLMGGYDALLAPANTDAKNFAPRIAAKLDVALVSDIIAVVDLTTFVRPIYAGNALETVQISDSKAVITVRSTAFKPQAEGGSAPVETIDAPPASTHSRFVSDEVVKSERPELAGAKIVVSGGRALGSAEEFHRVIEPLADRLGAAVGACARLVGPAAITATASSATVSNTGPMGFRAGLIVLLPSENQRPARVLRLLFRVGHPIHLQPLLVDQRDHAALVRKGKRLRDRQDPCAARNHGPREIQPRFLCVEQGPSVEIHLVRCGVEERHGFHLRRLHGIHERSHDPHQPLRVVRGWRRSRDGRRRSRRRRRWRSRGWRRRRWRLSRLDGVAGDIVGVPGLRLKLHEGRDPFALIGKMDQEPAVLIHAVVLHELPDVALIHVDVVNTVQAIGVAEVNVDLPVLVLGELRTERVELPTGGLRCRPAQRPPSRLRMPIVATAAACPMTKLNPLFMRHTP